MAGEVEEPLSFNFQSDYLHSGSISFGRFEKEDLSWERRSSFSHNRYLEEVEKCSKPGSVIEKKAYFEAHFKKKGILLPAYFEGQTGGGYQSRESNALENVDDGEVVDDMNDSNDNVNFDASALENVEYENFEDENGGGQSSYVNGGSHSAYFDNSPEGSDYHGDCEEMESEKEDSGVLSYESQMAESLDNANSMLEVVHEDVRPEEPYQNETGCYASNHDNDKQEMKFEEYLAHNSVDEEVSSGPACSSPKSRKARDPDKASAVLRQSASPKLRVAGENQSVTSRSKAQVNTSQVQKNIYANASKSYGKNLNVKERDCSQREKPEKQSPQATTPARRSLPGTLKGVNSENFKSRVCPGSKSVKEVTAKKVVQSQPSGSKKVESRVHQSPNSLNQAADSAKTAMRSSTTTFSLKSNERAEKRKEFFTELEEKMHAKEAEINQIHTKTQEKTEAEIKQFRRSLNFKASPMPSFYHAAVPPASKAVLSKRRPDSMQQKSTRPASGASSRSQLPSRAGNESCISASESVQTTDLPESSLRTRGCPTSEHSEACDSPPRHNHEEVVTKSVVTGKNNGQEKVKNTNSQRHRVPVYGKVSKDQKVDGKPKTVNSRNGSEMVRKGMKGIGIGKNAGMGRVAVGVAS